MALHQVDLLTDTCGVDPSWICEQVLDATSGNEFLARTAEFLLARPLKIVLIMAIASVANRFLRRAIHNLSERIARGGAAPGVMRNVIDRAPDVLTGSSSADLRSAARAQTIGQVLRSVGSAVIFVMACLLVLGELGINLGPLLAGAGIAGVAIGFGAQSLVKDFLSGVFMILEDQYGVGDVIDVGEATGKVEAVTLRSTRLRDAEGTVWHVPNGEIRRVGNKSQEWARAVVDVDVAFDADLRRAHEVLSEVAAAMRDEPAWALRMQEDPEVLGIESVGPDGSPRIRVMVQTEPGEQFAVMRELRLRLAEGLVAAGVRLPVHPGTTPIRSGP